MWCGGPERAVMFRRAAPRPADGPYRLAFDASREAVFLVDADDLTILDANDAAVAMYRTPRDELLARPFPDLSGDPEATTASARHAVDAGRHVEERPHRRDDGSSFAAHVEFVSDPASDVVVVSVRDLSEREHRADERFERLVARSFDVATVFDARWFCTYASPSSLPIFGERPEDLVGETLWDWVHPGERARVEELVTAQLRGESRAPIRFRRRHRDGSWRVVDARFTDLLDDPVIGGVVCNAHDVTDLALALDRLEFESVHDPVTGLKNRRGLFQDGAAALGRCARRNTSLAVLVFDLDGFRALNDAHGFALGDEVLWRVADVLRFSSRVSDLVTRAGGDEFVLLSEDIDDVSGLRALARRIADTVGELRFADGAVRVGVSIGACLVPGDTTIDDALAQADELLAAAKARGGGIEIG